MKDLHTRVLTIGPKHLEWLGSVLGLYAVSDRPALEELLRCLPSMSLLACPAGSEVVREGERGEELFILYQGAAKVARGGNPLADLVPGDFFGEIGFLVGVPRTATVTAGPACEVFRIHCKDFDEVVHKFPKLMDAIRATAKDRMKRLGGKA